MSGFSKLQGPNKFQRRFIVSKINKMKKSMSLPEFNRQIPLIIEALFRGMPALVHELLKEGVNPDTKGERTDPLLMCAVQYQDEEVVEMCLRYGADPNTECDGKFVLQLARELGNRRIVDLLLEYGANHIFPNDKYAALLEQLYFPEYYSDRFINVSDGDDKYDDDVSNGDVNEDDYGGDDDAYVSGGDTSDDDAYVSDDDYDGDDELRSTGNRVQFKV
jgi:hypothetical protein